MMWRARIRRLALGAVAVLAWSAAQAADTRDLAARPERRVALVVGMSRYEHIPRLDNPRNDATLMADRLRGLGFALVGGGAQLDLDKPRFDRAVQDFGQALARGTDVALFYYAGHGVQIRGRNWLVPITANPTRDADADFQMIDAEIVLRQMEAAGTRLNLMILDACRNNPFGGRGLRATTGGLAEMQAPQGTLISYATQPGNVAQEGAGGDSPFTQALAETIARPGLDVFTLFNEVGLRVKRMTAGAQQPWVSSSPIDGDFYFVAPAPPPAPPGPSADALEQAFWDSLKDSNDPGVVRAYLERYPNGKFAAAARERVATLDRHREPAPSPGPSAAALEEMFWDSVKRSDDPGELQSYLDRYPNGTFAARARARIAELQRPPAVPAVDPRIELTFWDSVKTTTDPAELRAYVTKYPNGNFTPLARARLAELTAPRPTPTTASSAIASPVRQPDHPFDGRYVAAFAGPAFSGGPTQARATIEVQGDHVSGFAELTGRVFSICQIRGSIDSNGIIQSLPLGCGGVDFTGRFVSSDTAGGRRAETHVSGLGMVPQDVVWRLE